jgi:hypothetical protein
MTAHVALAVVCAAPIGGCGRFGYEGGGLDGSTEDGPAPQTDAATTGADRVLDVDGAVGVDTGTVVDASAPPRDASYGIPDATMVGCVVGPVPALRFTGYVCDGTCDSSSGIVHFYYESVGYAGEVRLVLSRTTDGTIAVDQTVDACAGMTSVDINTARYLVRLTAVDDPALQDAFVFDFRVD